MVDIIDLLSNNELSYKVLVLVKKIRALKTKKPHFYMRLFSGMDGTRTRDPVRDRHVF